MAAGTTVPPGPRRTNVLPLMPCTEVLKVAVMLAVTATAEDVAAGLRALAAGTVRAEAAGSAYSRRFGVPAVAAETLPVVAAESSFDATSPGSSPGDRDSITAAAPATCGE